MSDTVILALLSLIGTGVSGYIAVQLAKLNIEARSATAAIYNANTAIVEANKQTAERVETVRTDLETKNHLVDGKLEDIKKVSGAIHTLVNSSYGAQLLISSVALRRIADLTDDPKDIAAADMADQLLADHNAQQSVVDSGQETKIEPKGKIPAVPVPNLRDPEPTQAPDHKAIKDIDHIIKHGQAGKKDSTK